MNFGHLCGLLLSFYFTKNIKTLRSTGASDSPAALFRRYLSTVRHVRGWYEGDVWAPGHPARASLAAVKAMHARVAARMQQRRTSADADVGVYVSQWDMAVTQWAFVGTLVLFKGNVGLHGVSDADVEALVHFWRGVGWLLGIEDEYNLCAGGLDDVEEACRAMLKEEYVVRVRESNPESLSMIRGVVSALSMLDPTLSPPAMIAYCRGLVGLPPKEAMTWGDWVCHGLTSLVMRHALRFETPRRALNALTRWRLDAADRKADARTGVTGG